MKNLFLLLSLSITFFSRAQDLYELCAQRDSIVFVENLKPALDKIHMAKIQPEVHLTRIVQIGDSHVQMGYFSSAIRAQLANLYGPIDNCSFQFPYSMTKGFDPAGMEFKAEGEWSAERMVDQQVIDSFGITGHALIAHTKAKIKPYAEITYKMPVTTLEIMYVYNPGWKLQATGGTVKYHKLTGNLGMMTVTYKKPVNTVKLKFTDSSKAGNLRILGFRNGTSKKLGLDVQSYGSSGARYVDYVNRCHYFFEDLSLLKPDLLIISLGTNDSYTPGLNDADYYHMVSRFVKNVKEQHPGICILITLPPDLFFKSSKPVSAPVVFSTLFKVAQEEKCALWNFAYVMGGENSMQAWVTAGIANEDMMHLNEKGYDIQGRLLVDALNKAYIQFYK